MCGLAEGVDGSELTPPILKLGVESPASWTGANKIVEVDGITNFLKWRNAYLVRDPNMDGTDDQVIGPLRRKNGSRISCRR